MLTNDKKQLIFDYSLGICEKEDHEKAKDLIASESEAKNLHEKFKFNLSPLDSLEKEECPQHLVDSTMARINEQSSASTVKLEELIEDEKTKKPARISPFWTNMGRRLATAAVFIVVGSAIISGVNYMHYVNMKNNCQAQLSKIYSGLTNYSADFDGKMPAVSMSSGTPWWKVGYQGDGNESNTRHLWLLPKYGYINPSNFVCPGSNVKKVKIDPESIKKLSDFPSRNHITYSFKLICDEPVSLENIGSKVIMADLNPLFKDLPNDYTAKINIKLNKELLNNNSPNHKLEGQNVLFGDGSVQYIKKRKIGVKQDDIFTLQNTEIYEGNEVPQCSNDYFLAP